MLINSFCILHLLCSETPPLQKDSAHPLLLCESSTHPALSYWGESIYSLPRSSQVSGNVLLSQYLHILFCLTSSKAFLLCDWTASAYISYCYMTVLLLTVLHTGRPSSKHFLQSFLAIFLGTAHKEVRITQFCHVKRQTGVLCDCALLFQTHKHTPLPLLIHLPGNLHSLAEKVSKLRRKSV